MKYGIVLMFCATKTFLILDTVVAFVSVPMVVQSNDSSYRFREVQVSSSLKMVSSITAEDIISKDTKTPILAPQTFAGMVERRLIEKFEGEDISRVIQSWRLLEYDYEHRETIRNGVDQLATSYVPGLTTTCFWETEKIKWCKYLEKNYNTIRDEFKNAIGDMDKLAEQGNNIWAGALSEDASAYGVGWSTLVLMDRGVWDQTNVALFPKTSKIVKDSGVPVVELFFASMEPDSKINMHSDFTNFVLTSHLAIDIPYSGSNKCRLTVGDETREWINGKVSLFDTSIMHDAVNEADKTRYILMMRVWHPDLTESDRKALQYLYDCLEIPDLASPDPGSRFMAEQRANLMHEFPQVKTKKKSSKKKTKGNAKGFGK